MASSKNSEYTDEKNASGVSELLKSSRLKSGEDIADIARSLRISRSYLTAIEEGRFEDLPGATYSLGFVRAYSEYLGLESSEVISQLKSQQSTVDSRTELEFPKPLPEASVPGGAVIFIGMTISLLAYGAWYINSTQENHLKNLIAALPERFVAQSEKTELVDKKNSERISSIDSGKENDMKLESTLKTDPNIKQGLVGKLEEEKLLKLIEENKSDQGLKKTQVPKSIKQLPSGPSPVPSSAKVSDLNQQKLDPVKSEVVSLENAEVAIENKISVEEKPQTGIVPIDINTPAASLLSESNADDQELALSTSQTSTKPPSEDVPNQVDQPSTLNQSSLNSLGSNNSSRIIIKAITTSWIQIRDDFANEIILTRLLREGDVYNVPKRFGLMLSAGNAGALDILVDGKPVPSIGGNGEVRRTVILDAFKLRAGTAVSE